jgi:ribosome-interacting GTPase 1
VVFHHSTNISLSEHVGAHFFNWLSPLAHCYAILTLQLLDLPGIIEGAKDGKGRGKQVIAGKTTMKLEQVKVHITINGLKEAERDQFSPLTQDQ